MIDTIMAKFSEKVFNACERHAGKLGVETKDIQLNVSLNAKEELVYKLYHKYDKDTAVEVTFNQVLGVIMDFKGYGFVVPPFIKDKLLGFARQHQVVPQRVRVFFKSEDTKEIITWLFIDGTAVEQIILQDLIET